MSEASKDKIVASLDHMVEAANNMNVASVKLRQAGDKATADKLDKVRADFRAIRLEVANRLGETTKR